MEHKLSVIENPQKHGKSYNKWLGDNAKLSNRELLKTAIDAALQKKPKDFDELLVILNKSGYTVTRRGKNLSFLHAGQKKNIRLSSLGDGYSEPELRAVIGGSKVHNPFVKKKYPKRSQRPTLIQEIESKLNSGKGYWYDQTMKVVKLKQMAKTLLYLEEKSFPDYAALSLASETADAKFYDLKQRIKSAETRMAEIQTLRTHIINYSKTREVYTQYRKEGYSKKFLAEHEGDIILHKAAKKAFDELGHQEVLRSRPTENSIHLSRRQKSRLRRVNRKAQDEMRELLSTKQTPRNVRVSRRKSGKDVT
jgi:hypothetical protein